MMPVMRVVIVLLIVLIGSAPCLLAQSRVILVRDPAAVIGWQVEPTRAHAMIIAGMKQLTGQSNEAAAWQQIVSSNDVVGIKISTLAAPLHVTHQAVLDAIAAGLQQAGVPATNIIVFDREPEKLTLAEYRATAFRVESVIGRTGWDKDVFVENSLVGKLIWGDLEFGKPDPLSTLSHLPKLVTRTITKLINVPVLMDHDVAGLAGCLYNISLGLADNTRRFEQFGQRGDSIIAELAAVPVVRAKLVLNICDAFVAGYAGGPAFKPQYSWPYGGLFFSRDPVAIDTMCLELLAGKRQEERLPPIGSRASHVITAARYGLGQTNAVLVEVTR